MAEDRLRTTLHGSSPSEEKPAGFMLGRRARALGTFRNGERPTGARGQERPYRDSGYQSCLKKKGSFMYDSQDGFLPADGRLCETLQSFKQTPPSDTLFDDHLFHETLRKIEGENEARVIRDISQLVTPSAECLKTRGLRRLRFLKESTNAGWNSSIPFEGPRPQPDFPVGFDRSAFSDDEIDKIGHQNSYLKSFFTATDQIFFPFFTSEVTCGSEALHVADCQNAHSITIAIRGVVNLFQTVGRAQELHRKVLAFSVFHDHQTVKIYAHYPEINKEGTKYYRHLLRGYDLLDLDGREVDGLPIHPQRLQDLCTHPPQQTQKCDPTAT